MAEIIVTSTADAGAGSLRQAIADAQDGDVILFDADVFPVGETTSILLSSYITVNKSVSIYCGFSDGNGGYTSGASKRFYVYREIEGTKTKVVISDPDDAQEGETVLFDNICRVALDGQGTTRGFAISSSSVYNPTVDVAGIEFIDGQTPYYGGAIQIVYSSAATLTDCNFINCNANYGGALGLQGKSTNYINNCYFASCTSTIDGGVSSIANTSQAIFNNCVFDNNQGRNGGVFRCTDTAITNINRCIITGCSATNGGCAYLGGSSQNTLNDCVLSDCSATNGGGVYSANTSQNTLNDCVVTNCSVTNNGGVACVTSNSVTTAQHCTFKDCTGVRGGAFMLDTNAIATFVGCTFDNCISSANAGGGIRCVSNSRCLLDGCAFDATSSLNLLRTTTLEITGGITTVATAQIPGATIAIADGAALTITDSATIGAATFTSDGRGYLALAPGLDASAATLTNVVECSYGADASSFREDLGVLRWDAEDPTTPVLLEYEAEVEGEAQWETLIQQTTGESYTRYFGPGVNLRLFDGEKFLTASTPSSRTYYYIGGAEGSFTAPTDWSLTRGGVAIPEAPTVKNCVFVVGDVVATAEEETTEETSEETSEP